MDRLAGKDILADMDHRPLRPSSLNTRRIQLAEAASAFVHGGGDGIEHIAQRSGEVVIAFITADCNDDAAVRLYHEVASIAHRAHANDTASVAV